MIAMEAKVSTANECEAFPILKGWSEEVKQQVRRLDAEYLSAMKCGDIEGALSAQIQIDRLIMNR